MTAVRLSLFARLKVEFPTFNVNCNILFNTNLQLQLLVYKKEEDLQLEKMICSSNCNCPVEEDLQLQLQLPSGRRSAIPTATAQWKKDLQLQLQLPVEEDLQLQLQLPSGRSATPTPTVQWKKSISYWNYPFQQVQLPISVSCKILVHVFTNNLFLKCNCKLQ